MLFVRELISYLVKLSTVCIGTVVFKCISTMELVSYLVSKVRKGTKIANYVPKQVER